LHPRSCAASHSKLPLEGCHDIAKRIRLGHQLVRKARVERVPRTNNQLDALQAAEAEIALEMKCVYAVRVRRAPDFFKAAVAAQLAQQLFDDVLYGMLDADAIDL
jgi:hypothetical protein